MDKLIEELKKIEEETGPFSNQLDKEDIVALQELVAGKIKELEKFGDVPDSEAEVDPEDQDAMGTWKDYQKLKSLGNKLSLLKI
jgi:hypothetical protein